jgi:glutathione S-transferase
MIKLYGLEISNYYAAVKAFMLEKGFQFEEVAISPSYSEPYIELSPMGKMPFIEVDEGYLSETSAILGFLESCVPDQPMTPADPFASAKMSELLKVVELYVSNESARLVGHVFFGAELNQPVADQIKPVMVKGLAAVGRLASFSPFMMGSQITMVDIYAYYIVMNARIIAKKVWGWDLLSDMEGLGEWMRMMSQRPMIKLVDDQRNVAIAKMFENA